MKQPSKKELAAKKEEAKAARYKRMAQHILDGNVLFTESGVRFTLRGFEFADRSDDEGLDLLVKARLIDNRNILVAGRGKDKLNAIAAACAHIELQGFNIHGFELES